MCACEDGHVCRVCRDLDELRADFYLDEETERDWFGPPPVEDTGGMAVRAFALRDGYGLTGFGLFVMLATGATVFVVAVTAAIVGSSRYYGKIICRNWSTQTTIPSKFVVLSPLSSGTCLARTPDGRWLLNTKVQEFIAGGGK